MSPEEAGCPAEYMDRLGECCSKRASLALLNSFGQLSPHEFQVDMVEYDATLRELINGLTTFLLVRDVWERKAWGLLALAHVRRTFVLVDRVKEIYTKERSYGGLAKLLQDARHASKLLAHSLFRLESYQQFLITHQAHVDDTIVDGSDPEDVRDLFDPYMEVYTTTAAAHDHLAYQLIPPLEAVLEGPFVALQEPGQGMPAGTGPAEPDMNGPIVTLVAVSLGSWAKVGFITIWSILKNRSTRLRFFIIADALGIRSWQEAVSELEGQSPGKRLLQGVTFEYVDLAKSRGFQAYLRRYPKRCDFGEAGRAILARVVSHTWLPKDVERVISIDLGDVLVFDDVRHLWDLAENFDLHQVVAVAHAVALSHMNGGLGLYNVRRMRETNYTRDTLRAARMGLRNHKDGICLRDQSIINILHTHRAEYGFEGPSPVATLPCRWSIFPTTEWQPYWNSPEMWLPEIRERRRYPGIVSSRRVEVFCPDEADLLSSWAFIPLSEKRQSRLRVFAGVEGRKTYRYCSNRTLGAKCCQCGEPSALIHVAGDLRYWPAMQNLLAAYAPPFKTPAPRSAFTKSSSQVWQGGAARKAQVKQGTADMAFTTAKALGIVATFDKCATLSTKPQRGPRHLSYFKVPLKDFALPLRLVIETTAARDAFVLLGPDGKNGLELGMGTRNGQTTELKYVRSSHAWAAKGDLMSIDWAAQQSREGEWSKFALEVGGDGELRVSHGQVVWGAPMPDNLVTMLRLPGMSLSVGTLNLEARWGICAEKPRSWKLSDDGLGV